MLAKISRKPNPKLLREQNDEGAVVRDKRGCWQELDLLQISQVIGSPSSKFNTSNAIETKSNLGLERRQYCHPSANHKNFIVETIDSNDGSRSTTKQNIA